MKNEYDVVVVGAQGHVATAEIALHFAEPDIGPRFEAAAVRDRADSAHGASDVRSVPPIAALGLACPKPGLEVVYPVG